MKTFKLEIKLPTVDEATRDLKPLAVRAEKIAAEAARTIEERRKELAECERRAREMPDRIRRGEVAAKDLAAALAKRDAAKVRVEEALADLTKATERAATEQKAAKAALEVEFGRVVKQLEDVVDQVNPVLSELYDLAIAIAKARDGVGIIALEWIEPPSARMAHR